MKIAKLLRWGILFIFLGILVLIGYNVISRDGTFSDTMTKKVASEYYCRTDADCGMDACLGAYNKKYLENNQARPPCVQYINQKAACIENKCTEVPR